MTTKKKKTQQHVHPKGRLADARGQHVLQSNSAVFMSLLEAYEETKAKEDNQNV